MQSRAKNRYPGYPDENDSHGVLISWPRNVHAPHKPSLQPFFYILSHNLFLEVFYLRLLGSNVDHNYPKFPTKQCSTQH